MNADELDKRFNFHPANDRTGPMHERVRAAARAFAETIAELTPESREQSTAITKIEEAMFWGNAAIARSESTR